MARKVFGFFWKTGIVLSKLLTLENVSTRWYHKVKPHFINSMISIFFQSYTKWLAKISIKKPEIEILKHIYPSPLIFDQTDQFSCIVLSFPVSFGQLSFHQLNLAKKSPSRLFILTLLRSYAAFIHAQCEMRSDRKLWIFIKLFTSQKSWEGYFPILNLFL